jgi:hypothetical protein
VEPDELPRPARRKLYPITAGVSLLPIAYWILISMAAPDICEHDGCAEAYGPLLPIAVLSSALWLGGLRFAWLGKSRAGIACVVVAGVGLTAWGVVASY